MAALPHMQPQRQQSIWHLQSSVLQVFQFSKRLAWVFGTSDRLSIRAAGVIMPSCAWVILPRILKYADISLWVMPYIQHDLRLHQTRMLQNEPTSALHVLS